MRLLPEGVSTALSRSHAKPMIFCYTHVSNNTSNCNHLHHQRNRRFEPYSRLSWHADSQGGKVYHNLLFRARCKLPTKSHTHTPLINAPTATRSHTVRTPAMWKLHHNPPGWLALSRGPVPRQCSRIIYDRWHIDQLQHKRENGMWSILQAQNARQYMSCPWHGVV